MTKTTAPTAHRWKAEPEFTDDEARAHARALRRLQPPPRFETDEWLELAERQRAHRATRRAAAERQIDEAKRDIGIAIIDAASGDDARQRLADAQAELAALDYAERELAQRDRDDERRHVEAYESLVRGRTYRWYAAYLREVENVLHAREALLDAEKRLLAIGNDPKVVRTHGLFLRADNTDLDFELLQTVPRRNVTTPHLRLGGESVHAGEFADTHLLTVQRAIELRQRAERLAAAEEAA